MGENLIKKVKTETDSKLMKVDKTQNMEIVNNIVEVDCDVDSSFQLS